jgi:hypothetical protein
MGAIDKARSVWHTPDATIRTSTSFSAGSRIDARDIAQVGALSLGGDVMIARVGVECVVVAMVSTVVYLGISSFYRRRAIRKKQMT